MKIQQGTPDKQRFNSIKEIIEDKVFIEKLNDVITNVNKERWDRPETVFVYGRDWYDKLTESGNLNVDYFLQNAEKVWLRTSKIPSNTRQVMGWICGTALKKAMEHYGNLEK